MQYITITDFSNESASKAAGEKLKNIMEPLLIDNVNFVVDFKGIKRFASPFFNNSFAKLAIKYGFDKINNITIENLSEAGNLAYNTSIANAEQLVKNPDFTEKINSIINTNTPKKDE